MGTAANGLSISVTAAPTPAGGDGFANVGFINAQYNLDNVAIHGDLGRIDAGNSVMPTTGLAALTVESMGEFGARRRRRAATCNLTFTVSSRAS